MLPEEQVDSIKQQIIQQIETNFPEDKKQMAISQVEAMNSEQLEEFLVKNNMIKQAESNLSQGQCIFCSIISGQVPSTLIEENKHAMAILEINPISKGHVLILPKEHISSSEKIPSQISTLAKKIAEKIKTKLKPKEVKIELANLFGHEVLNVFPVYGEENIQTKRYKAEQKELEEIKKILGKKTKARIIKEPKTKIIKEAGKKLWLPKRIP